MWVDDFLETLAQESIEEKILTSKISIPNRRLRKCNLKVH